MHASALFSALLVLASTRVAAVQRGPPYDNCPNARQNPTGKGYAMFSHAAAQFRGDDWTNTWADIAEQGVKNTIFECANQCWRDGPSKANRCYARTNHMLIIALPLSPECKGVNWFPARDKNCIRWKNGGFYDVIGGSEDIQSAIKGPDGAGNPCAAVAPKYYPCKPGFV